MRPPMMIVATILVSITPAIAAAEDCKAIQDTTKRLECYDRGGAPAEATTKDIVTAPASALPQTVDATDLYVAPKKYIGKRIELRRVQCFYADKDEYRCIAAADAPVLIVATDIMPTAAKDALERDCGQIKKVQTQACRRVIRFTPVVVDHDDAVAFAKRTVVVTKAIEVVAEGGTAKRR